MLKQGDAIDRYVIESLLGDGGMGVVYRAHDPRLDRTVAVKVVHVAATQDEASRTEATARVLREARAAAKIDHPNAIAIFDVGEANGDAFIAMELVDGQTLRDRLGAPSFSQGDRLRVLTEVARALVAAHAKGIVHRDVKPENIMVRRDGVVKVLDFGIARRAAGTVDPTGATESAALLTLTAKGVAVGTPLYMTPEQIRGEPMDGRGDQFAWGVVAWEVFAGSVPWSKTSDAMALAGSILQQPAGSLSRAAPDVPPELATAIERALSKSPGDRYASMADLVDTLDRCARGVSASTPPADGTRRPPPAARYSTETGRAILSLALERQAEVPATGYGADDILAAAREVGVDDETLRAAERDVTEKRTRGVQRAGGHASEIRKFAQHAVAYGAVVTFLLVTMGWWVAKWVIFGWGIGIVSHALRAAWPDTDRRRRKKKGGGREERRPQARGADRDEIERGADELLLTAARRVRVAEPSRAVRVAVTSEGQNAAEEAPRRDEERAVGGTARRK